MELYAAPIVNEAPGQGTRAYNAVGRVPSRGGFLALCMSIHGSIIPCPRTQFLFHQNGAKAQHDFFSFHEPQSRTGVPPVR